MVVCAQEPDEALLNELANLGELQEYGGQDTLPIEIYNDIILIDVKVNGTLLKFMWDNGFSFSALDKEVAAGFQLSPLDENSEVSVTDGVNRKLNLDLKMADEIALAHMHITNSPFLSADIQSLFGDVKRVHGVLGATVIKKLNWHFNFDEKYIIVSQRPFDADGIEIPFMLDPYNTMLTSLIINGQSGSVEIDFGYNGENLQMNYMALPIFGDVAKNRFEGMASSSVSGFSDSEVSYTIKDFEYRLGDTVLGFPIEVFLTKSERNARVGNAMFRHYNCIVNSSENRIILYPRKIAFIGNPEKSFGFNILKVDNKLIITGMSNYPNGEKFPELKLGMEVVEINGKKVSDFDNNFQLKQYQLELLRKDKALRVNVKGDKSYTLLPALNIYE